MKRRSYTPQFKADAVLDVLKGEKTAAQACLSADRSVGSEGSLRICCVGGDSNS